MNKLRIAGGHYDRLRSHLYPGDNKEAVAVMLCGRSSHNGTHTLLVQELLLVPYEACFVREPDNVQWTTDIINPLIEKAAANGWAVVKIHCHPGGYESFSARDDQSDYYLFESIHAWLADDLPHASCIMLPDGRIFGRFFTESMDIQPIHQVSVAGSDIHNWYYTSERVVNDELQVRNMQAFGKGTVRKLNRMKIGVVGCSGTGSPTIEQLKRLGIGELVMVDPDYVDFLNLNRILNTTYKDAEDKMVKVEVMKRSIEEVGFGTNVKAFAKHISVREVVKELADCDILFSCVDGAEGRHILNLISSYYIIPLFDMGIKLIADGQGGIDGIYGSVHYVQPLGSSLLSRQQYDLAQLQAESQRRIDKDEYERNRYLARVNESSPAVISINMQAAATAVNEFLARIHAFRNINNRDVDVIRIMYSDCATYYETFKDSCPYFSRFTGMGDMDPLLNNIELG